MICGHVEWRLHPHGDMLWSEKNRCRGEFQFTSSIDSIWPVVGSYLSSMIPVVILGKAKRTVRQYRSRTQRSQTPNWGKDRRKEPFQWFGLPRTSRNYIDYITVLMFACNPWREIWAFILRWTTFLYTFYDLSGHVYILTRSWHGLAVLGSVSIRKQPWRESCAHFKWMCMFYHVLSC